MDCSFYNCDISVLINIYNDLLKKVERSEIDYDDEEYILVSYEMNYIMNGEC